MTDSRNADGRVGNDRWGGALFRQVLVEARALKPHLLDQEQILRIIRKIDNVFGSANRLQLDTAH